MDLQSLFSTVLFFMFGLLIATALAIGYQFVSDRPLDISELGFKVGLILGTVGIIGKILRSLV